MTMPFPKLHVGAHICQEAYGEGFRQQLACGCELNTAVLLILLFLMDGNSCTAFDMEYSIKLGKNRRILQLQVSSCSTTTLRCPKAFWTESLKLENTTD